MSKCDPCKDKRKGALTRGMLNRKITIQEVQTVVSPEGIPEETWVDVMTLFAYREPLATRSWEYFEAAAIQAEKTVRYKIRYRKGILPNMRVVDEGRIYNIKVVMDDVYGDRTETYLMTQELEDG